MSKWLEYAKWNKRDEKMASLWAARVAQWIRLNIENKKQKILLDYGCSYFSLGEALSGEFQEINGFDIDPVALKIAQRKQIPNSNFFNSTESFENDKYDVITLSSVMQYFDSLEEVDRFFAFSRNKLMKNTHSVLLITDLIPENYTPWVDAFENLIYAIFNGAAVPMIIHLSKAATSKADLKLFKINKNEIKKVAEKNGFKVNYLDKNLTPSRRRYSCVCTLK